MASYSDTRLVSIRDNLLAPTIFFESAPVGIWRWNRHYNAQCLLPSGWALGRITWGSSTVERGKLLRRGNPTQATKKRQCLIDIADLEGDMVKTDSARLLYMGIRVSQRSYSGVSSSGPEGPKFLTSTCLFEPAFLRGGNTCIQGAPSYERCAALNPRAARPPTTAATQLAHTGMVLPSRVTFRPATARKSCPTATIVNITAASIE
jgi:hypothetical protein